MEGGVCEVEGVVVREVCVRVCVWGGRGGGGGEREREGCRNRKGL